MKQKRVTKAVATKAVEKIIQWVKTLPPNAQLGYSFLQDGYRVTLFGWANNLRIYAFDGEKRIDLVESSRVCKLDAPTLVALAIRLVEQWPLAKACLLAESYGQPSWAEQLASFQP